MAELSAISRRQYRALVHEDPDFWPFYTQATPISHISRLPIASRPVSRSGKALTSVDDLRAIPWVFAWVQSRYLLPGWYGLGAALDEYAGNDESRLATLQTMYAEWPFFRTMLDSAQLELLRAHLPTATWYAQRVRPPELATRLHGLSPTSTSAPALICCASPGGANCWNTRRSFGARLTSATRCRPAVTPASVAARSVRPTGRGDPRADLHAWRDAILLSITESRPPCRARADTYELADE
jgi:phosphoenolpyruvate carboxylase